jgi:hypothetical protein
LSKNNLFKSTFKSLVDNFFSKGLQHPRILLFAMPGIVGIFGGFSSFPITTSGTMICGDELTLLFGTTERTLLL